jgi:hypothetical protein
MEYLQSPRERLAAKTVTLEHLKYLARTNDLYSRLTSLQTTAAQFSAEAALAMKVGEQPTIDFFLERWFFAGESARVKNAIYDDVITKLIDLLNVHLVKEGKSFSKEDLLSQHVAYNAMVNLVDKETNTMFDETKTMIGRLTKSVYSTARSVIDRFSKKPVETLKGSLVAVFAKQYADLDSDDVLKYPYDAKLDILMNCHGSWKSNCVQTVVDGQREIGNTQPNDVLLRESRHRLDRLIAILPETTTQRAKNALVDSAIEIAFRTLPTQPSYVGRMTRLLGKGGTRKRIKRSSSGGRGKRRRSRQSTTGRL